MKVPRKLQILLFPASNAVLSILAFQAISAAMPGSAQSLLVILAASEFYFGALLVKENVGPEKTIEPDREMPKVLIDGKPIGRIVPIAADHVFPSLTKQENLQVLDPRIQQWAWAVTYENTPMTQSKWCGKKRLFSKPAYVAFIFDMLKDNYVAVINPKDPKSSYKANGAAGREYIKSLADRRAYRPFPTLEKSETDTQFLRAQMSRDVQ